jgi:tRNA-modifying protein YgfZ
VTLLDEGIRNASQVDLATVESAESTTNLSREYAAVRSDAAAHLLADRVIVRIVGDDRVSFLHGMCTADIKGLKPDGVTPGLFLTEHAHVIADFFAYGTADNAILIEMERAAWPRTRAHLEKFLVADDVEMEEAAELGVLDIEGPRCVEALRAIARIAETIEPWRQVTVGDLRIANLPRLGTPALTVIAESARLEVLIGDLRAKGIGEVSAQTLDLIRIEQGIARVGIDTGEKTIALEARLEPAISFSKGCYVGQETVERATAHGSLKKRLCGLRIAGTRIPVAGSAILIQGKEIGRLTSIGASPRLGTIGLAIMHHSAWPQGSQVVIADGGGETPATVSDLPLQ